MNQFQPGYPIPVQRVVFMPWGIEVPIYKVHFNRFCEVNCNVIASIFGQKLCFKKAWKLRY